MKVNPEHACPRCYVALVVDQTGQHRSQRVVLTCPEAYCEYVLVLGERGIPALAGRLGWPKMAWFKRAAS